MILIEGKDSFKVKMYEKSIRYTLPHHTRSGRRRQNDGDGAEDAADGV